MTKLMKTPDVFELRVELENDYHQLYFDEPPEGLVRLWTDWLGTEATRCEDQWLTIEGFCNTAQRHPTRVVVLMRKITAMRIIQL